MAPNKKNDFLQVGYVNGEFVTSTLFASFIPIFPCVDLISIRIHNTAEDRFSLRQNQQWT